MTGLECPASPHHEPDGPARAQSAARSRLYSAGPGAARRAGARGSSPETNCAPHRASCTFSGTVIAWPALLRVHSRWFP